MRIEAHLRHNAMHGPWKKGDYSLQRLEAEVHLWHHIYVGCVVDAYLDYIDKPEYGTPPAISWS